MGIWLGGQGGMGIIFQERGTKKGRLDELDSLGSQLGDGLSKPGVRG